MLTQTTLWMTKEEIDRAKQLAEEEDLSFSQLVRKLLRRYRAKK